MSTSSLTSTVSAKLVKNLIISKTNSHDCDGDGPLSSEEDNIGELNDNLQNISSYSDAGESYESDTNDGVADETNTQIQLIMGAFDKNKNENVRYYNKTFSINKIREIERNNTILMNKICSNNVRINQYPVVNPRQIKVTSNSINRRRRQQEIDHNNLVSCNYNYYLTIYSLKDFFSAFTQTDSINKTIWFKSQETVI